MNAMFATWIPLIRRGARNACRAFLLALMTGSAAWADTVAYWNFNSNPPDASTATGTTAPKTGNAAALLAGTTVTNSFGVLGTSPDPGADNTSWRIARFRGTTIGNKSSGVQFNVSTLGYQNLALSWAQRNSDSASRYWRVQYSTNGVDFHDHTVITTVQNVWQTFSVSFGPLPGVIDNPNFAVRLVSEFQITATGGGTDGYVAANPGNAYSGNGTLWLDTVAVTGDFADPFNAFPTITPIISVTTRVDTASAPLPFSIGDAETAPDLLQLTATAAYPALVQAFNLSGAGPERTVQIIPAAGQLGATDITVGVRDEGGKTAATVFRLTVLPLLTPPILSTIPMQSITWNTAPAPVSFTLRDLESPAEALMLSVSSSNGAVVPQQSLVLSGTGEARALTFALASNALGSAIIALTATDPDGLSTSTSFIVKALPAQTIAWWNFNSVPPDADPATGTTAPTLGAGSAGPAGLVVADYGAVRGAADPEEINDSNWFFTGFPTQGTSNKQCGAEFRVSTAGYENIVFFWDQRNSDSASRYSRVQYTLNGADWMDHRVIDMPLNLWVNQQSASFVAIPGAADNPNFGVRLVAEFIGTALGIGPNSYVATDSRNNYSGTSGTHRFDMVYFHGDVLRPRLNVTRAASVLEITWPVTASIWTLESTPSLDPPAWQPLGLPADVVGTNNVLTLSLGGSNGFFRLSR